VDLLASGWGRARPDEAAALGLARPGMRLYVREVCVRLDGRPAVLARSITTLRGIRGPWQGLRRLGRRPLAALVWTDPLIRRGRFEYAKVPAASLAAAHLADRPWLPARRSCFWRDGEPLIVLEAFAGLPWPAVAWQARRRSWMAHDRRD
jgi:chorismate--pyruvate lyase